eukprot:6323303-Pyramimonas_sp.AAC.1
MSDHCPLTMELDSARMGIKLDGKWADTKAQTTRRAKRIRKGLQPEETQAVREMLEDEVGDEVARCTQLIGKVRGVDRQLATERSNSRGHSIGDTRDADKEPRVGP